MVHLKNIVIFLLKKEYNENISVFENSAFCAIAVSELVCKTSRFRKWLLYDILYENAKK